MINPPPSEAISVRVLGDVGATGPHGSYAAGRSRPGALLVLLLLGAGRTVGADRLLDELWPGNGEPVNAKRLHVTVTRLRQALARLAPGIDGAALVQTRASGYALGIDLEQVDAFRFERLAAGGRRRLESGDPRRAAADLRTALGLWRGDAFAGFAYEAFASFEIRRLEELRLTALEDWAQAELEIGGHARIAAELEGLVKRHPLRERMRELLMLALYRCRRQGDALATYREARLVLVDELGIEPSRELRELERAILLQSPLLEWPSAGEPRVARGGWPIAAVVAQAA